MRTIRALTIALAVLAVVPEIAAAQPGRPFKDSWFWGVKSGLMAYSPPAPQSGVTAAPLLGLDWVITRTRGGLYVSGSFGPMDESFIIDTLDATDTSAPHTVSLSNLMRIDFAAMAFPDFGTRVHPYAGLGVSIGHIGSVSFDASGMTPAQEAMVQDSVSSKRTGVAPLLIAGAQVRLPFVSAFGQFAFAPMQRTFFLSNSGANAFSLELGVRYNIGSSIEGSVRSRAR